MAVGRISGPLLKSNLERNGIDLAFETDLLYLDVNNARIGIGNAAPSHLLDITGTINSTVSRAGQSIVDNIIIDNNSIVALSGNITLQGATVNDSVNIHDVKITQNEISPTTSNTDLILKTTGSGLVNINNKLIVSGPLDTDTELDLGTVKIYGNASNAEITTNIGTNLDLNLTADGSGKVVVGSEFLVDITTSLGLPVGTIAQRPLVESQGQIRFNTDTGEYEGYNGTDWINLLTNTIQTFTQSTEPTSWNVGDFWFKTVDRNWFEGDGVLVFDPYIDQNTVDMNFVTGEVATGTGDPATITIDYWHIVTNAVYTHTNGAVIVRNRPWLIALVFNTTAIPTETNSDLIQWGNGNTRTTIRTTGTDLVFRHEDTVDGNIELPITYTEGAPSVLWLFNDGVGNLHAGHNQTTDTASSYAISTASMTDYFAIDATSIINDFEIGTTQVISRVGMTITDAKAIVQNMQDYQLIT